MSHDCVISYHTPSSKSKNKIKEKWENKIKKKENKIKLRSFTTSNKRYID